MKIIWQEIPGYEGFYASKCGLIKRDNGTVTPGSLNGGGYYYISICGKMLRVHRLLALTFLENSEDKPLVDHINRNTEDNAIQNLRWVTRSENARNVTSHKLSTSNFLGVSWHKATSKWMAQILVDSKTCYLGVHENEEDAARAYDEKAAENGFLHLNFPAKIN